MRRKSYRYIFIFNVLFVVSVITMCFAMDIALKKDVAVNTVVTSPLIYADSLSQEFCSNAQACVLVDAKSGAVLFEKNANKRLPMASTTKIMTALVVLENANVDDVITIDSKATGIEGSSIYLMPEEKITVYDLLCGLLLESGNDAAEALAIGVFDSTEKCVEQMNSKCRQMGLLDTHFDNVHGLDSINHYTTAYELSLITANAMKNELFRKIVSTENYVSGGERKRYFSNHNRLLDIYSPAIGVKTGYTTKAGRCLVSAATDGNEEYIAVTLNDPLDWKDHENMLTFAFDNFKSYEIADKETFRLCIGFEEYTPTESIYITTTEGGDFKLNYKIILSGNTGRVDYSTNSASLGTFGIELLT